jgi:hypothetical protein
VRERERERDFERESGWVRAHTHTYARSGVCTLTCVKNATFNTDYDGIMT